MNGGRLWVVPHCHKNVKPIETVTHIATATAVFTEVAPQRSRNGRRRIYTMSWQYYNDIKGNRRTYGKVRLTGDWNWTAYDNNESRLNLPSTTSPKPENASLRDWSSTPYERPKIAKSKIIKP